MAKILALVVLVAAIWAFSWVFNRHPDLQGVITITAMAAMIGSCAGCKAADEGGAS